MASHMDRGRVSSSPRRREQEKSYRAPSANPYLNGSDPERTATPRRPTARGSVMATSGGRNGRTIDERSHRPVRRRRVKWYYFVPVVLVIVVALTFHSWPAATEEVERGAIFPVRYSELITDSSTRHNIDPYLVCAIIKCESGWNANAVSSAGARGLMQVMEETAKDLVDWELVGEQYDPKNLEDPATNIEFGCTLLDYLDDRLKSEEEVIAAYNAGPGAVEQWNAALESGNEDVAFSELITYSETKNYLEKVTAAKAEYQRLYPDGIK